MSISSSMETPALTQAAIRFADASQASAQVHLLSVVKALSPLEASLLEFQAVTTCIDHHAIMQLWSEAELHSTTGKRAFWI